MELKRLGIKDTCTVMGLGPFLASLVMSMQSRLPSPGCLPPVQVEVRYNRLNSITEKAAAFDSEFKASCGSPCALSWFPRAQHFCWAKHRGCRIFYLAFFLCLPVSSHPLDAACFLSFPDWMWSTVLCDPTPDACTLSLLFARTCHMLLMDFLEVEHFPLVRSICHNFLTDFSLFFSSE